jgi:hypothetical protein
MLKNWSVVGSYQRLIQQCRELLNVQRRHIGLDQVLLIKILLSLGFANEDDPALRCLNCENLEVKPSVTE